MNYANVFKSVPETQVGRSVFNLSYEKKFDCNLGQWIPVMCDEMVPGDTFQISNEIVIRFQPLVAPILHEVNVYTNYFFVPYRILDPNWENFITGGFDGKFDYELPLWNPTSFDLSKYSQWDYLGFPLVDMGVNNPLAYIKRAMALIFNEYLRDQDIDPVLDIMTTNLTTPYSKRWEKDYFTSARPWQLKGVAPAMPVTLEGGHAEFTLPGRLGTSANPTGNVNASPISNPTNNKFVNVTNLSSSSVEDVSLKTYLDDNVLHADADEIGTFNIADLRLATQLTKWLEKNARSGSRYTEYLKSHFGRAPRDERLQRPERFGGTKSPVLISEVQQTSGTDSPNAVDRQATPQGNLAGRGIVADRNFVGSYTSDEFGVVIGLMCVIPRSSYMQGINRQWLRRTRFDFYDPLFAHLSEQPVYNVELYADGTASDSEIFGWQQRYAEMRYKPNLAVAGMRDTFDYWHFVRKFGNRPVLNSSFLVYQNNVRPFAVQDERSLIVNYANNIRAIRPMPYQAVPGLLDH